MKMKNIQTRRKKENHNWTALYEPARSIIMNRKTKIKLRFQMNFFLTNHPFIITGAVGPGSFIKVYTTKPLIIFILNVLNVYHNVFLKN